MSTMTNFALALALEDKLSRKSRESSFHSSNNKKTKLSEWDLNVPDAVPIPGLSSTSTVYGMPTLQSAVEHTGSWVLDGIG